MKRLIAVLTAAAFAGCIYEGREPGRRMELPADATDGGARVTPIAGWNSGRAGGSDGGTIEGGTTDAAIDGAIDGAVDGASDTAVFPTPELVVAGEGYLVSARGDALATYVTVASGGSLDTQLQLHGASARVLQNGTQILARNRVILDDVSVAASNATGVFLYPRAAGARVDVAFGFMPQGVQLAGLTPTHVYYLRPSQVPGGLDGLHRRDRSGGNDEIVACSIGTSAFDVAADGFTVVGRAGGTFALTPAPLAGACTAETAGTKLSSSASPAQLLVGSARVLIGSDVGTVTSLTAVPRAGGATESIGAAGIGLWGSEPGRPLAELSDTLFYVEEASGASYVVERPPLGASKRLGQVGYRKVRAVSASATHVYYATPEGIFRVPR